MVGGSTERAGVAGNLRTTGGGDDAGLALAVVVGADDEGAVDVAFDALHLHFLADSRQEVAAHAAACAALGDAYPAAGAVAGLVEWVLPVVADADAAELIAADFVVAELGAVSAVIGLKANDSGSLAAVFDGTVVEVLGLLCAPGTGGIDGDEGVGVSQSCGGVYELV